MAAGFATLRGGRGGLRKPLMAFGNRRGGAGCRARAKSMFEVGLQGGLEVGLQDLSSRLLVERVRKPLERERYCVPFFREWGAVQVETTLLGLAKALFKRPGHPIH